MEPNRPEPTHTAIPESATIPLLAEFLCFAAAVVASVLLWRLLQNAAFLLLYPVVMVAALRGGFFAGAATGGAATAAGYLLLMRSDGGVGATPRPPVALLCLVFLGSAVLISAYADRLHRAARLATQQREDSNQFAAKLHLQLMLAEAEVERLRTALEREEARASAEIIRPLILASDDPAEPPELGAAAAESAAPADAPPAEGPGAI
jgi:hypothetical protein